VSVGSSRVLALDLSTVIEVAGRKLLVPAIQRVQRQDQLILELLPLANKKRGLKPIPSILPVSRWK